MTDPDDEAIREAVKKLTEAAKEKAIDEATDTYNYYTSIGGSHTEGPTDEERERIDQGLKDLTEAFENILTPHPDKFDFLIEHAKNVETSMGVFAASENPTKERIGGDDDFAMVDTAKGEIQKDWDGRLRNQLIENYLTPLYPAVIATQGGVARILRQNAELMQNIYVRRRKDAKKTAEEGLTAIEAINDSKGSDLKIILSIVSGIVGLGAALAGPFVAPTIGPLALGLSTASLAAGVGVGGNFIPADKEPVPLGADTVQGVVENIYEALKKSDETMQEEEDELIKLLQDLEGLMYPMTMGPDSDKGNELIPMFPAITEVSDIDEIKEGMTSYSDDDGGGGEGGRGSYKGPNPPEDFDGSVDDTSGGG